MIRKEILANLNGVIPPVVTPFNCWGEVDVRLFRQNLLRYHGMGLAGVLVAGSTGEAPYLTDRERLRLTEIAREYVRPPKLLVVGTGLESTDATLRLSRAAIERGADVVLVITPSYYRARMDGVTLATHFRRLADGLRRPLLMYNIPQFTGIRMQRETIGALSRHPNIVGLKESSGDIKYVRTILRRMHPRFKVLVGSPLIFLDALRAGAVGAFLGVADFVPELCVGLYEAFRRRQMRLARDLQRRLTLLAQKIAVPYGVAGVKAALEECGYAGGSPRAPLLPLAEKGRREVAAALREAHAGLEF